MHKEIKVEEASGVENVAAKIACTFFNVREVLWLENIEEAWFYFNDASRFFNRTAKIKIPYFPDFQDNLSETMVDYLSHLSDNVIINGINGVKFNKKRLIIKFGAKLVRK